MSDQHRYREAPHDIRQLEETDLEKVTRLADECKVVPDLNRIAISDREFHHEWVFWEFSDGSLATMSMPQLRCMEREIVKGYLRAKTEGMIDIVERLEGRG